MIPVSGVDIRSISAMSSVRKAFYLKGYVLSDEEERIFSDAPAYPGVLAEIFTPKPTPPKPHADLIKRINLNLWRANDASKNR